MTFFLSFLMLIAAFRHEACLPAMSCCKRSMRSISAPLSASVLLLLPLPWEASLFLGSTAEAAAAVRRIKSVARVLGLCKAWEPRAL